MTLEETKTNSVTLEWLMFDKFVDYDSRRGARDRFVEMPCIYIQTDREKAILRVGATERSLQDRYWGGTAYTIEAAMHGSGNLIFVAAVPRGIDPFDVERTIIQKENPRYNNEKLQPKSPVKITNTAKVDGEIPMFKGNY